MHASVFQKISPYILFSPFLLLYIFYVLHFHTDEMFGDESRYIQFAQNLLNGFYSPAYPNIDLINGPGYPIILMPFVAFKTPLICITLLNALFQYVSIIFLFKSILLITNHFKTAVIVAICWASYFLAYQEMPCILSESFTLFLISALSYQIITIYSTAGHTIRTFILPGLLFGFLILTKVIFAYVLLLLIVVAGIAYFLSKKSQIIIPTAFVLAIAFMTILPYITYTYSITGKIFYLSSEGGKVLYWMTSPDENEYGDWNNNNFNANCSNKEFCNADLIAQNHSDDIQRINQTANVLEADALFKSIAVQNIKNYPIKYMKNWFANIGRLLFGFPASYYFQSPTTLVRIYINSILLLALIYSVIVSLFNWKKLPIEIKILIGFSLFYLGLSSLVSAYPRQLNVVVPALLVWITYAIRNSIKINLKISDTPH